MPRRCRACDGVFVYRFPASTTTPPNTRSPCRRVWDAARAALLPGRGRWLIPQSSGHRRVFNGTDRRTQAGFFDHPFSVGWVIDPVRREQAWFVGPRSQELPIDAVVALGASSNASA